MHRDATFVHSRGERGMTSAPVGDALPPLTIHLTREHLVRYAGASADFNPIHFSELLGAGSVGLDGWSRTAC